MEKSENLSRYYQSTWQKTEEEFLEIKKLLSDYLFRRAIKFAHEALMKKDIQLKM